MISSSCSQDAPSGSQTASARQSEHDFLIALQNACLTFPPKERPLAVELKDVIEDAFGTLFLDTRRDTVVKFTDTYKQHPRGKAKPSLRKRALALGWKSQIPEDVSSDEEDNLSDQNGAICGGSWCVVWSVVGGVVLLMYAASSYLDKQCVMAAG